VRVQLCLLDAFELVSDGVLVRLPLSAQRVVAFVALQERPLLRTYVAGSLWLDSPDDRAGANPVPRCGGFNASSHD
jgi:DNA-binding SARP family transcriptional activator